MHTKDHRKTWSLFFAATSDRFFSYNFKKGVLMKMNRFFLCFFIFTTKLFAPSELFLRNHVEINPVIKPVVSVRERVAQQNASIEAEKRSVQQTQSRAAAKNTSRPRSASLSHTAEPKQIAPTRSHSTLAIPDVFKKESLVTSQAVKQKPVDSVPDLLDFAEKKLGIVSEGKNPVSFKNEMTDAEIIKKLDVIVPAWEKLMSQNHSIETRDQLQALQRDLHPWIIKVNYTKKRFDEKVTLIKRDTNNTVVNLDSVPNQLTQKIALLNPSDWKESINNYSRKPNIVSSLNDALNELKQLKSTHIIQADEHILLSKKDLIQKIDNFVTSVEQQKALLKVENYQTQHSTPAKTSLTQKIKNFFTRTKNPAERKAFFTSIVETDAAVKCIGSKNTLKSVTVDKDADAIVSKVMGLQDRAAEHKFGLSLMFPGRFDRNTNVFNKGNVQDKLDAVISALKKDENTTHIANENSLVITSKEDCIKKLERFRNHLVEYSNTPADRKSKR